ncbi:hypothetical protein [Roseomonas sp. KE0001]|uniref:hypothetical protein n=1 Tax=Roseomonas sp. KE0001 TaxID=2479201 RepID=UPI0018DFC2A4|nr:hypothetical protein [Roseomonas sp. KE0001]MBI0433442.1 hypothetical protein [Roseomonas sp. KE0001]
MPALFLAGCGLQEELDALDRQNFERGCANLGITRASPNWEQCMLQQQANETYKEQQLLNRINQENQAKELKRGR